MIYKDLSDHALSRELDRLERTGTIPGSDDDKIRSTAIAAVRCEFGRRQRTGYALRRIAR